MRKMVLSILVGDESGVLSRVAGLFSRRGYNIESLTVGATSTVGMSRMTIVCSGEENVLDQIKKQLGKLIDVKSMVELPLDSSVFRELILIKIAATASDRQDIIAIADIFRAKIVDVSEDSMIIELTGNQSKLSAFTELLKGYKILELARTGITGLSRGQEEPVNYDSVKYV
ncbi:MAG TPA: acetolactate synthase small subunit [Eubacterium sp.]|jgi:acetolactate synthase-1/3 small subunit|nr:acetolactate synthase small subunit [Eubacterium sp.]HBZ53543.1 acetolactate synthase small subunit [Eubacterium sp.]